MAYDHFMSRAYLFDKMAGNERPKKKEVTFKIIVVGNADVGKSSLVKRYVTEQYDSHMENTIAVDCLNKEVTIQEQPIRLNIWDTAGSERYLSVGAMYYRNADGVLFVFDVTKPKTFTDVQTKWLALVARHETDPDESVKVLVGTKSDRLDEDEEDSLTDRRRWEQFAIQKGMRFFLVSAQSGACVNDLFMTLAEDIAELRRQTGRGRTYYDSSLDDATMSLQSRLTTTGSTKTTTPERESFRLSNLDTLSTSEVDTPAPDQRPGGCSC